MRLFIKRFWGFGSHWPIISFSQRGSLDRLLEQSEPGDVMAFVGTQGAQTAPDKRGRLLGLAEFGRGRIRSQEVLPPTIFAAAAKGPTGDLKWPYAVVMTRAWRFTDIRRPVMMEVIGRQLSMAAMSNAVLLSAEEQIRVLALPREEIDVASTQAIWDERERIAQSVGEGGTMGPVPTSFATQMIRGAFAEASTYAYRFGSCDVWKIGWAHDPSARLTELNKHIPSEILNSQCWHGGYKQKWASAEQAYAMEQNVLAAFDVTRKYGERVHCTEEELWSAWLKARKGCDQ